MILTVKQAVGDFIVFKLLKGAESCTFAYNMESSVQYSTDNP